MDRQDRERNDYRTDYGPYEGYSRDDAHYHGARNLTDDFERDYQRHIGHQDNDFNRYSRKRSYHEGDMGGTYEQLRREDRGSGNYSGNQRNDWDRDRDYTDSYSNYQDDLKRDQESYRRDRDRGRDYENMRQSYGSSDRYNTYSRNDNRDVGYELDYDFGSRSHHRSSRYPERNYGSGRGNRSEDNWYSSGRRSDELNRYY